MLGDKDTIGFAFATAGKLHEMYAVALPPGATAPWGSIQASGEVALACGKLIWVGHLRTVQLSCNRLHAGSWLLAARAYNAFQHAC
jgi:hypothetical protein